MFNRVKEAAVRYAADRILDEQSKDIKNSFIRLHLTALNVAGHAQGNHADREELKKAREAGMTYNVLISEGEASVKVIACYPDGDWRMISEYQA